MWRDAASKLHQQLYVHMRKHIDQLTYFLFRQHGSAVYIAYGTFFSSFLRQKMKHMQPSPCLYARCFVLFSLHCNYFVFRMWMQYFFALFTRHERNKQLARAHVYKRRRRVEGGAAVTSYIHWTPSRVYLTDYIALYEHNLLMVQKHVPQFSLCFCCSHHCPRTV